MVIALIVLGADGRGKSTLAGEGDHIYILMPAGFLIYLSPRSFSTSLSAFAMFSHSAVDDWGREFGLVISPSSYNSARGLR